MTRRWAAIHAGRRRFGCVLICAARNSVLRVMKAV